MYLVVVNDERGALVCEQELTEELTIGRTTENQITLPSNTVSRRHAVIYLNQNSVFVRDLESQNGVFVNDVQVRGTMQIDVQHQVRVGTYRIAVERLVNQENDRGGYQTTIVHPNQAHAKLVVMSGSQVGKEFCLFEPITSVGRTEENEINIAHISISRHHAQIKLDRPGAYIISDANSSNGTFVNNKRIQKAMMAWHGDTVRFGQIDCLLVGPQGQSLKKSMGNQLVWVLGGLVLTVVLAYLLGQWI